MPNSKIRDAEFTVIDDPRPPAPTPENFSQRQDREWAEMGWSGRIFVAAFTIAGVVVVGLALHKVVPWLFHVLFGV